MLAPNKRLKLTGGDPFNGSRVLCPDGARTVVHFTLRRRAGRPQLKRDPLGGALPPHRHSFANSFGTVSTRGAERGCSRRRICAPRPTPHGRATGAPRRARPSGGWLPTDNVPTQGRARAPSRTRRVRPSVPSAPSNTRLELAAPGGQGRIPFMTNQARRRSSSAIR